MGSISRTVHNAGTAIWWGGTLMGTLAMNPAVEVLDDIDERGKMVDEGWARFQPWAAGGLFAAIITHLWVRRDAPPIPSGRYKFVSLLKDLLMLAAVVSSVASMALGEYAMQLEPDDYSSDDDGDSKSDDIPSDALESGPSITPTAMVQLATGLGLLWTSAILQTERERTVNLHIEA